MLRATLWNQETRFHWSIVIKCFLYIIFFEVHCLEGSSLKGESLNFFLNYLSNNFPLGLAISIFFIYVFHLFLLDSFQVYVGNGYCLVNWRLVKQTRTSHWLLLGLRAYEHHDWPCGGKIKWKQVTVLEKKIYSWVSSWILHLKITVSVYSHIICPMKEQTDLWQACQSKGSKFAWNKACVFPSV